jgi:hypothetical protein
VCPAPVQQSCERALREPLLTKVEVGERTASIMSLCRPPICLSLTNKRVPMFSRYSASSAMGAVRVLPTAPPHRPFASLASPNTRLASMATPGSAAKMAAFCLSSGCLRRGPRPHQCRVGERFVDVAIEGARTQQVGLLQSESGVVL